MTALAPYYQDDLVTLYHADWRDVPDELRVADVLVTDPPYGMGLRSGWNGAFGDMAIAGDDTTEERDAFLATWGDSPALVFGRWSEPRPAATRMVLTWEKGEHVGMGDLSLPWKPNTEEVYVLGSGFVGHRSSSVIKWLAVAGTVGMAVKGTRCHPTQKPLDLMRDLIQKCPSGTVLDPFAGSGSTLVAAKSLNRRAIGIEVEERWCEVAANRLRQDVLGLSA